jgi:multidrug resistance efflux pump
MVVRVSWERADHRRQLSVTAPLFVAINGISTRAASWSLEHVTLAHYPDHALPDVTDPIALRMSLPFQGFDIAFDAIAHRVEAVDSDVGVTLALEPLGDRERSLMSHFIQEVLRGSMVPVEDTIQRIDVPVMPLKLTPDVPQPLDSRPSPWRRTGLMTGAYLAAGLVVFGYLGRQIGGFLFRIEVPTAMVAAPVEAIQSQGDGSIAYAALSPGDHVEAGQIIVRLSENQLEREIEQAELTVREREVKLKFALQRLSNDEQRLLELTEADRRNKPQMRAELDKVLVLIKTAEQEQRVAGGQNSPAANRVTLLNLASARLKALGLRRALDGRAGDFSPRPAQQLAADGRRFAKGARLMDGIEDVETQVALAAEEVRLAGEKMETLQRHRERLAVRAPFSGRIVSLPHADNATVKRGDVLAIVEKDGTRQVTAFLSREEAGKVGVGDRAWLQMPALGETLEGRIESIDWITTVLAEQEQARTAGTRGKQSGDRTTKVTVTLVNQTIAADGKRLRSGVPVVATFENRRSTQFLAAVKRQSVEIAESVFGRKANAATR